MKKHRLHLILTALIITVLFFVSCKKEDKLICIKTVTVYYNGVEQSQEVSRVVSFNGSSKNTTIERDEYDISIITVTEIDCDCE